MKHFKLFISCLVCSVFLAAPLYAAKKNQGPGGGDETKSVELCRQAIIKANNGAYDQAITLFDTAVKASTKNPLAFYNRGKVFMIQGKYDKAIGDFDKAAKLNPDSDSVYVARGMAFRLVGDFSRAVKDFTKAVAVDPKNTNALIHRAALYFDMGEHESALQDLDRILALNPRMFNALGNRAYILEQMGRYDDSYAKDFFAFFLKEGAQSPASALTRNAGPTTKTKQ